MQTGPQRQWPGKLPLTGVCMEAAGIWKQHTHVFAATCSPFLQCMLLGPCCQLPCAGRSSIVVSWCRINGGYKGVDFVGDIACPDIDFATLHVCKAPPRHAFSEDAMACGDCQAC